MTVSISDMTVPPQKPEMIKKAQDTVDLITKNYKRGLITEEERYKEVVDTLSLIHISFDTVWSIRRKTDWYL